MTATAQRTASPTSSTYWTILKNLSDPVKLELIALLSNSVVYKTDVEELPLGKDERKRNLMSLAGCWADDPEDAARMEAAIREGRENDVVREINLDD